MSDFGKILKLTWKRFSVWIILGCLFLGLSNSFLIKNKMQKYNEDIIDNVAYMEKDLHNKKMDTKNITIDEKFLEESDKIADEFAKKYNFGRAIYNSLGEYNGPGYEGDIYLDKVEDQFYTLNRYEYAVQSIKNGELKIVKIYTNMLFFILVFTGIFTMALTSMEESMAYYDFTRMLPWSKKKEMLMKIGLGFIFTLGLFIVNLLVVTAIVKSSAIGGIVNFDGLAFFIIKSIGLFAIASIVSTSLGLLAGNFLGHIGLMIIGVGAFEWFKNIILVFLLIFSEWYTSRLEELIYKCINKLSPNIKPILSLTYVDFDNSLSLLTGLAIAFIIGLVAYLLIEKSSSERSGYLVKNEILSKICKFAAIFSLTSVMFVIANTFLYTEMFIIRLVVYVLAFLISYKFFDILFNIRLKF